ncbi:cytochrome P450 oxidoreductase [Ilyonectria sp. MPI-CAGE-AT-0026]|nr:cytochrome P450 oxidoreductase [Ilyonectria sp. MPI-CAGE-AT-0026]
MAILTISLHGVEVLLERWPVILAAVIVLKLLWNRYGMGLNGIPGPTVQSFSMLPRAYQVWKGKIHLHDMSVHEKYGKLVRIGPRLVSIADVTAMNTVYGINTKFYKASFYDPSTPYDEEGIVPDPFILKDKAVHSRMKRNAANAYSLTSVVQLEPYVNEVAEKLFTQLDREAKDPSNSVCLDYYFHAFALDAIFMLSFGKSLNMLEKGDERNIMACFEVIMPYMATIGQIPWMHKFLVGNSFMAKVILGEMTFETGLLDIATTQVAEFKKRLDRAEDGPCTFTERLLMNQKANPKSITDRELITHALGNITAGGDTTSITLRSMFYFTLRHTASYKRLCEEVRSNCTFPATFASARDLPYLNAVIKEALRLHPPMAIMLARTVPKGGAEICGHFVPEGTECGISAYVLHRDPGVFPDPEAWKPERWLTADTEHLNLMNRAFFSFGSGPHTCSGRHISIMEITKIVPSLLLRYDFELAYPDRPWTFRVSMLAPQKGVYVKLKRRL